MTTEKQLSPIVNPQPLALSAFSSESAFESAQRMAKALVSSKLVPVTYQGTENIGSAIIALEIAQRLGASPLMVMQNLYVVHGRPAWSAQFVIAALNSCGRFAPLRFEMSGAGDSRACFVWTTPKISPNERLEGPAVSIEMSKKEGWFQKNGSKWQTMPELMLRYRAASFFGKLYAPEILMGMQTDDEVIDITPEKVGTTENPAAPLFPTLPPPAPVTMMKCDGNHGGPKCADPDCWHVSAPLPAGEAASTRDEPRPSCLHSRPTLRKKRFLRYLPKSKSPRRISSRIKKRIMQSKLNSSSLLATPRRPRLNRTQRRSNGNYGKENPHGDLTITKSGTYDFEEITGSVDVSDNATFDAPVLQTVGGSVDVSDNATFDAPSSPNGRRLR